MKNKYSKYAFISFCFSLIGFIISGVIADNYRVAGMFMLFSFFFGIISLKEIKQNKNLKGKVLAKISICFSVLILILILFFSGENLNIDEPLKTQEDFESFSQEGLNFATLGFIHNNSCKLDGEIFFGENLVGFSKGGRANISKEDYLSFWTGEITLRGITDSCFGRDSSLPFIEEWAIKDLNYYFENDELLKFMTDFNPRWPYYPEAMQGFIRPNEVKEKFSKINLNENNSAFENIEIIFGHTYMNYVSDRGLFKEEEFWQTPSEFISNKGGDCEDWAVYLTSLLRAYDPNLSCYAAIWYTHVNVLCHLDNKFVLMDQDKVKSNLALEKDLIFQDNQIKVRSWRNGYFEKYGIPPDERILFYLINDEEIIEFENGQEDLINWILERGGINQNP